jgi:glycosyltransferase involved in cell wall biosynthesis
MAKILITIPHPSFHGGVGNIFRVLKLNECSSIEYFHSTHENKSANIVYSFVMLFRYVFAIWDKKIVHLNPSLNGKSIIRDGILLLIAKVMSKNVVIFFHGWDDEFERKIASNYLYRSIFSSLFSKADSYILLGEVFKKKLHSLGVKCRRLYYLPTIADDSHLGKIERKNRSNAKAINILFISGFVPLKGIDIVLQTFHQLKQFNTQFHFKLTMAGDGPELPKYRRLVKEKNLTDVTFTGYVSGIDKHNCFNNADLLFFPAESEGLPCVIMEGMLYGLAIVTRPVGGIPYWVKHNINGWLSSSRDPIDFAEGILELVSHPELRDKISEENRSIALNNFTPEKIKANLLDIYTAVM